MPTKAVVEAERNNSVTVQPSPSALAKSFSSSAQTGEVANGKRKRDDEQKDNNSEGGSNRDEEQSEDSSSEDDDRSSKEEEESSDSKDDDAEARRDKVCSSFKYAEM